MTVWQADFYRRPLQNEVKQPLWELVVCNPEQTFSAQAFCPQSEANSTWIANQLLQMAGGPKDLPQQIQVFRPQSVSLIAAACQALEIAVEPTRRTSALKQLLQQRAEDYHKLEGYTGQPYEPVKLEQPPPVPLPENLWGEQWRFAAIATSDLESSFKNRPIPILQMPEALLPVNLQLASTVSVPGVVIDGGRQSMRLARWLQETRPVSLNYIPGEPNGLILEAGLVDRWVVTTFDDQDVISAAQTFQQRQQTAQGLHFLLVQPDDSGMTYSGFWLLRAEH
ncbi:Tab2/Atab2 family RNA-binding protein [Cyanobacteria bacterium FACHB-471]|nr:Tab2/Atab2 family RNA-binding protein [Cyanobacteria bacterium FACHB-471]